MEGCEDSMKAILVAALMSLFAPAFSVPSFAASDAEVFDKKNGTTIPLSRAARSANKEKDDDKEEFKVIKNYGQDYKKNEEGEVVGDYRLSCYTLSKKASQNYCTHFTKNDKDFPQDRDKDYFPF